ncbi:NAD-dependent epimerase/dehydratase family protein [Pectobacterium atrosepticum]|uniref:NAD-dependent epimerase/dehydratase family protein n=1 Tax=Pectobacterium atrosepticum TaxID=29471 RepID=UPI00049A933E|nr:NAD(P)-dependent oxidoreductase [Pectobacterium atrosepticum]AIA70380.1 epimerase [Pectobacterium atrosepticum]AIK13300.1 putative dTDP-glucose 4,6-dehydratase [Pectobacterium atrosepticum]KFX17126.1 epimerase [Pectobacterium atrosepticum]KMK80944.1 putative dTDP-glucose 4,6-dehydratase [Pectobacterium atrosepticum ICMP 1526]POW30889.1 epimerase [Pectobacterium atrosepticum]
MHIAILGCTSQIAKDLIRSIYVYSQHDLILFGRTPQQTQSWLAENGITSRCSVNQYEEYPNIDHDVVINFVGIGDPSKAAAMGGSIFDITLHYDELVLNELKKHPDRRYLFLSSGAAYGSSFLEPADADTPSTININNLLPQEYYSVAKLHAECRHRSLKEYAIVDLRVFNVFSRTQDLEARFFITDIVRAIQSGTELITSSDMIYRDFMHPKDFYQLVERVLNTPPMNISLDCYSRQPVDKATLLDEMKKTFGLSYRVKESNMSINATGIKPCYYSKNKRAAKFGYLPEYSSLETIIEETNAILGLQKTV